MGTTTPIHDALAEALRELQQDLDLVREVPVGPARDPAGPADAVPADDAGDGPEQDPDPDPDAAPSVAVDAEQVVALAWCEADERGHACFGTGHLLLGLVRADGPEAGLLAAAGVTARSADAAMALVASSSVSEPVVAGVGGDPVADPSVAEVLDAAAATGHVTAAGLLTALLARRWGQAAEMLAALGVVAGDLASAVDALAEKPSAAPRPMPRDPSSLLSSTWRRAVADVEVDA
jgi:hypothetical protein